MAGNAELSIILRLRDEASKQLAVVTQNLKSTTETLRPLGIAAGAFGGAMLAGVGLSVKAALEERQSQALLANTLKSVGVAYDSVKNKLEDVIQKTMLKTGVTDEDQRSALTRLIITTGNYELSLEALPAVLDLATTSGQSLESAAVALGKALMGNNEALARMGIIIPEGLAGEEASAYILGKIGGSAEAAANPLNIMSAALGEILDALGTTLLGDLDTFAKNVTEITTKVTEWIDKNPELTKSIMVVATAVAVLLVLFSAFVLAAPGILAAGTMIGSGMLAALGPISLIILAVIAVIAIIALLIIYWDEIGERVKVGAEIYWKNFKLVWGNIGTWFSNLFKNIHDAWDNLWRAVGETWSNIWRGTVNIIISGINWLIGLLNKINITLPSFFGGGTIGVNITPIPKLAVGGIVTGPTRALIGESGPEAVIPLNRLSGQGGNQTINVTINGWVGNDQDIAEKIRQIVILQGQRNAGTAFAGFA